MPRIRSIKPEFFTSEAVAELTLRARLPWGGLWTHCDDEGRCRDNHRPIHAPYPLAPYVSADDVAADLAELARHHRVLRLPRERSFVLEVTNWGGASEAEPSTMLKVSAAPSWRGGRVHCL
jgi:hypothetical protein